MARPSTDLMNDASWQRWVHRALSGTISDGLVAAAVLDYDHNVLAVAGAMTAIELRRLFPFAFAAGSSADRQRLAAGDVISVVVDERPVALGFAKRQLWVVAVLASPSLAQLGVVRTFHEGVEYSFAHKGHMPLPSGTTGGSGSDSGPADLEHIEYGITVRRERGKA